MMLWGIRLFAFALITVGAMFFTQIVCDQVSRRSPVFENWARNRQEMLENTGILLASWRARGNTEQIRDYLEKHRAKGFRYALYDARSGKVLMGNPAPEAAQLARRASKTRRYAINDFSFKTHILPDKIEALPFLSPQGQKLIIGLKQVDTHPEAKDSLLTQMVAIRIAGIVLALGVIAALVYASERPVLQLRTAMRRLAAGDYSARLDPPLLRRNDTIGRLAKEFNRTAANMARKQQAQRLLLSEISHEMRSPLSRMAIATELVKTGNPDNKIQLIERIRTDSDQLNSLSGQLMDFVRLQWLQAVREPLLLAPLLQKVVAECDAEAGELHKKVLLSSTGSTCVSGNTEQLSSMFRNIIRNAVRHTPENTNVEVIAKEVSGNGRGLALIFIRDKGPGLPEEDLERVMEPFQQGKCPGIKGETGLGLAIARQVAETHEGGITLENRLEGGLQVTIRLPLRLQ